MKNDPADRQELRNVYSQPEWRVAGLFLFLLITYWLHDRVGIPIP